MNWMQNSHVRLSENKLPNWPQQQRVGFWIQTDWDPYKIILSVRTIKRGHRWPRSSSLWLISVRLSTSPTIHFRGSSQPFQKYDDELLRSCYQFFVAKPFQFFRYWLSCHSTLYPELLDRVVNTIVRKSESSENATLSS